VNRFILPAGVFVLLVAVLAVRIQRAPNKTVIPSALIGKPATQYLLPVIASSSPLQAVQFDSRSLAGRWHVVNVWGTWCPECRVEHPVLLDMAREAALPIIGLDWKDDDMAARRWLESLGDPYDVVVADREGRTAIDFGVYGAPETFLIDDRGVVVHKHVGAMTPAVWQRDFLARLPARAATTGVSP
jgi:cytochrome c biogenesis protein CcmG/thiol:disulfide interchange protein DsbE